MTGSTDHPRIAEIQTAVAAWYGLDVADMRSDRRQREIARPRQLAMYMSRELTPRSYQEIGRQFCKRDHTTVIHACRAVAERLAQDRDTQIAHAEIHAHFTGLPAEPETEESADHHHRSTGY